MSLTLLIANMIVNVTQRAHVFYKMHISNLTLKQAISNEAFTTVNVKYSNPHVSGPLHLEINTSSGGNTLPMRTYHLMFQLIVF